jgi:hypothetical protein
VPGPNAPAWVEPFAPSACRDRDPDCRRGSCGRAGEWRGRRNRRAQRWWLSCDGVRNLTIRRRGQRRWRRARHRTLDSRQRSRRRRGPWHVDGDLARVDDAGRGRGRGRRRAPPPAGACSAVAGRRPERVWVYRPRASYPTDPAPGARCPATGSCRGCGPPRPGQAQPVPRAPDVPALPSLQQRLIGLPCVTQLVGRLRAASVDSHSVTPRPTRATR